MAGQGLLSLLRNQPGKGVYRSPIEHFIRLFVLERTNQQRVNKELTGINFGLLSDRIQLKELQKVVENVPFLQRGVVLRDVVLIELDQELEIV